MTKDERERLVAAINAATNAVPNLWLHEVSEDEWHVCYWGDRVHGEKRKWTVVREAASEDEAAAKRDEEIRRRRGEAALQAIEQSGYWLAPVTPTEELRLAFREAEERTPRGAMGQTIDNYDRAAFSRGWEAAAKLNKE